MHPLQSATTTRRHRGLIRALLTLTRTIRAAALITALSIAPALAAGDPVRAAETGPQRAADTAGIGAVIAFAGQLTDYVTAIAASVAVLFITINGVRWTTSGGNPSRQAEARSGLAAAVVGLALAVSANLIVNLVLAALK